jgi:hypothetical protein
LSVSLSDVHSSSTPDAGVGHTPQEWLRVALRSLDGLNASEMATAATHHGHAATRQRRSPIGRLASTRTL